MSLSIEKVGEPYFLCLYPFFFILFSPRCCSYAVFTLLAPFQPATRTQLPKSKRWLLHSSSPFSSTHSRTTRVQHRSLFRGGDRLSVVSVLTVVLKIERATFCVVLRSRNRVSEAVDTAVHVRDVSSGCCVERALDDRFYIPQGRGSEPCLCRRYWRRWVEVSRCQSRRRSCDPPRGNLKIHGVSEAKHID